MVPGRTYGDRASNVKYTTLEDGSELREFDNGAAYAKLPGGRNAWVRGSDAGPMKDVEGVTSSIVGDADQILSRFRGQPSFRGGTTGTTGTGSVAPSTGSIAPSSGGGKSGGGGGFGSGGSGGGGGGLIGQIADAYSQPLDFGGLPGLSGVSAPSQSVDFTNAFDPRFQSVNFMDPFDSRLQGVSFGGGTQGVDFSGGGPSVATLDWNDGGGGQAMAPPMQQAPPPMMQQPPMQQAPPMQGGGKGAGKGGAAAQPQPFGRLYG